MKTKHKNAKQVKIIKNKEIIININGKKYKHFIKSESRSLKDSEMYILEYLLNKYKDYEVDTETQKSENNEDLDDNGSNDEVYRANIKKKKSKIPYEEEENEDGGQVDEEEEDDNEKEKVRSSIYKSKKVTTSIKNNKIPKKSVTRITEGEVVEIKDLKGKKRNTKKNNLLKNKNSHTNSEYSYSEENVEYNYENNKKVKKEEIVPKYIEQFESYTSPTIKKVNEQKAENAVLDGINSSLFIKGQEKKGILFLCKNNIICFIPFDQENETNINLENIKKIYFNVNRSANIKDYEKSSEERFLQIIEINDKINDIKFNNEKEYEYFIKGIIQSFKNKTQGTNKDLIYQKIKNLPKNYEDNDSNITNNLKNNNMIKNLNEEYDNNNSNKNNETNGNEDDDIVITTTITEVFKNGELINKQTKEKMDGIDKSLHVYSPDMDEYEIFLRSTKLGQDQLVERIKNGLPTNVVEKINQDIEIQKEEELKNNNDENPIETNFNEEQK